MATVSTTLKMFDQFSQPLQRVVSQVNSAVSAMGRLQRALQVPVPPPIRVRLNLNLASMRTQINSAGRVLGTSGIVVQVRLDTARALRQASALRAQILSRIGTITARLSLTLPGNLNNLLTGLQRLVTQLLGAIERLRLPPGGGGGDGGGGGGGGTAGWLSKLKGMADNSGVQELFSATLGGAMEQQRMQDMFIARTGDAQIGTAMFERFKADAMAAGQDVNKSLQSTLSFFPVTQNTDQLTGLNSLAQRLSAFDSAGNGIEGAAAALKGAWSGDIASLAGSFNLPEADIRAFGLDELGKSGDVDGFIKAFDQLLEKQGMGQAAFETMLKSPAKQMEILGNNVRTAFANAGGAAVKGLLPIIVMLNDAFQAGKFQVFFDMLSQGLGLAVQGLTHLIQAVQWIFQLVADYGPEISAMLLAWRATYIPTLVAKLWAMIPPLYTSAAAWLTMNWPILAVVAAVGLVVFALRQFGVTTEQMVGFAIGIFYTLFAMIYNSIAFAWNQILAFAEFLGNIFIDPVYAVQKLFYDMIKNVVEYFGGLIKGIAAGLDWLIKKGNEKFRTNFELIGKFDTSVIDKIVDKFKPTTDKGVVDLSKYRMNQKDLGKFFQSGYSTGAGLMNKTAGAGEAFKRDGLDKWGAAGGIPGVDKVGGAGKINDKVDIPSEDLTAMRDLAEMKNIQNFVTLTPTVQVTTGDIHQPMDVNKMIRQIEEAMAREMAQNAEGVYL